MYLIEQASYESITSSVIWRFASVEKIKSSEDMIFCTTWSMPHISLNVLVDQEKEQILKSFFFILQIIAYNISLNCDWRAVWKYMTFFYVDFWTVCFSLFINKQITNVNCIYLYPVLPTCFVKIVPLWKLWRRELYILKQNKKNITIGHFSIMSIFEIFPQAEILQKCLNCRITDTWPHDIYQN